MISYTYVKEYWPLVTQFLNFNIEIELLMVVEWSDKFTDTYGETVVLCLTQLSTIFQLCGGIQLDSFIGGRNPPPQKKNQHDPTCRKSLTNFIR